MHKSFRKFSSADQLLSVILIPFLVMNFVEWMHRGGILEAFLWMWGHPAETLFNYLILFALFNILLIFSQGKIYFVLSSLLCAMLSMLAYVSNVKNNIRGEPLSILDFNLLGEAEAIAGFFGIRYYLPLFAIGLGWVAAAAAILRFTKPKAAYRLPYYIIALFSSVFLIYAYQLDVKALASHKVSIPADVGRNHEQNGFLLGNLVDSKFLKVPVPARYGKEEIGEVYSRMIAGQKDPVHPAEKPNVILILGESFSDLKHLPSITFSEDPIPFIRGLSETTLSGTIEVPGVGGGTANTEFEVLTGLSSKFIDNYNVPYNPYSSYIHRPIPSLGRIFSEQGYATAGFHTYHGWFYRRSEVYKHLGFDKFVSVEFFPRRPQKYGIFARDRELYELVKQEIAKTPERDFISAITVHAHGPYHDVLLPDKSIALQTGLSDKAHTVIENYANLLKNVDADFEQLVEHFQSFDEPTVIVYYGDHIPPFGNDVYKEAKFNIYGENGRKAPFLIWSNDLDLNGHAEMNANLLGACLLHLIGFQVDPYMNYLHRYYEQTPLLDKAADETMHRDFALLHYDIMHGNQYIQEFAGKLDAGAAYEFGVPLHLADVRVKARKNKYIIDAAGTGFSWMSALRVNGEEWNAMHRNGRVTVIVPKEQLHIGKENKLKAVIVDSRGKTIKQSNEIAFPLPTEAEERDMDGAEWRRVKLDGSLPWELFAVRNDQYIVRTKLDLDDKQVYFVENDRTIFADDNADTMADQHTSDIYPNGYLYLSVSQGDSGWEGKPGTAEIKAYFDRVKHDLYLAKE